MRNKLADEIKRICPIVYKRYMDNPFQDLYLWYYPNRERLEVFADKSENINIKDRIDIAITEPLPAIFPEYLFDWIEKKTQRIPFYNTDPDYYSEFNDQQQHNPK